MECKNCHANMPEEANICLECLTLCEEKPIEKGDFSSNTSIGKSFISYIFIMLATICICFAVSSIDTDHGKIYPANSDLIDYNADEESNSNSNNSDTNTANDSTKVRGKRL